MEGGEDPLYGSDHWLTAVFLSFTSPRLILGAPIITPPTGTPPTGGGLPVEGGKEGGRGRGGEGAVGMVSVMVSVCDNVMGSVIR